MAELLAQIIERAKSFQILKWQYHNPTSFNPYKLASQGYECTGLNTLECHICHHTVVFSGIEGEMGKEKGEEEIKVELEGHEASCLYFGEPGKVYSRAELYLRMDQLIHPVKQSHKNSSAPKLFPTLNLTKLYSQLSKTGQTETLNQILSKSKLNLKQVKISFILTLLGWGRKNMETLECAFCGRCVSVKDYRLKMDDLQVEGQGEGEGEGEEAMDLFDEHRYFCFWVYEQKGWEIYMQHLYDKLGEAEQLFRKDPEDVKKVRTLIDGYLQKFKNLVNENFQKASKILTDCSQMVSQIEQNQENQKELHEEVLKRKRQMRQFLEQIDQDVRTPLKRVKID